MDGHIRFVLMLGGLILEIIELSIRGDLLFVEDFFSDEEKALISCIVREYAFAFSGQYAEFSLSAMLQYVKDKTGIELKTVKISSVIAV